MSLSPSNNTAHPTLLPTTHNHHLTLHLLTSPNASYSKAFLQGLEEYLVGQKKYYECLLDIDCFFNDENLFSEKHTHTVNMTWHLSFCSQGTGHLKQTSHPHPVQLIAASLQTKHPLAQTFPALLHFLSFPASLHRSIT